MLDRTISVAPMLDRTDRHGRYFLRGFSPRVLLYTEMIVAAAIVRGDARRLLAFDPAERPLALQLGGSDPVALAAAARVGEQFGYDEINLNCGCPSDRVQAGEFGACLMLEPARVGECVVAMREAVRIPVTVKHRIGVVRGAAPSPAALGFSRADGEALVGFARHVWEAGAQHLIVHARKAVLGGLSPADNRRVPPLHPEALALIRGAMPGVSLSLNGGLRTVADCEAAWRVADGAMIGREAYRRPALLGELHVRCWDDGWTCPPPGELLARMAEYAAREVERGERLSAITRHMHGLFADRPGAREFRRELLRANASVRAGASAAQLLRAARPSGYSA